MSGKDIRETVGLLLVVASMVFVGWEIRQNTASVRAQTRQFLTENHREWVMAMASDPSMIADYNDTYWPDNPSAPAATRASYTMFANLRHLENVFLQVQEGVVDESVFRTYGWVGRPELSSPQFRDWWVTRRTRFDPAFASALEAEYDLAP